MKLIIPLLTVTCLQLHARSFAQEVTLEKKNISLEKVFDQIYKQTGYQFVYPYNLLKAAKKVSIHADHMSLKKVLAICFEDQPFTYLLQANAIIVRAKSDSQASPPSILNPIRVTGHIIDSLGNSLIGVTIKEKNGNAGAVTNTDGSYSIMVPDNAVLIISYVGYLTQEIPVKGSTQINIVLKQEVSALDQLVVVGYGRQKKANLTGAIATITQKELENRPITNVAQALEGKVANLNVYNSDGGPGKAASFNIRGYAGLGQTYAPLVIIDGVTGYLDDLNPNDIATITVLKDAAASAIYGAQAAYGVILISTKKGQKNQKPVISYTSNFSYNEPTVLPKTAGSVEFAKLFREASLNEGGGGVIDPETIDRIEKYYKDPNSIPNDVPQLGDPDRWSDWGDGRSNANANWAKAMFKSQINQMHNVSIRGGSSTTTYMMSLGYTHDAGKLRYYNDYFDRFNISTKISTDVTKWLTIGSNVRYARGKTVTPAYYMDPNGGINSLINWIWVVWPTIPVFDPNGHFSPAGRMAFIAQANPDMIYSDNIWETGTALFKILPGLTANIDITYNKWASKQTYSKGVVYSWSVGDEPYIDSSPMDATQVWQNAQNDDFISSNAYITYEKYFGRHSFKLMVGGQQEYKKTWGLYANKKGSIISDQPSISTATGASEVSDALDHWTTRGFFGRFNYNFNEKYLVEFDLRRDGSSRYPDKTITSGASKWGTFPSLSAGWNIAKEAFFSQWVQYIPELKLRGSWGELGNMRGQSYQYISTISYDAAYPYLMNDQRIGALGTPSLIAYNTWETNRTIDFGLDIAALKDRLTSSFDWYQRDIIGLITKGVTVPAVLGATSPSTNNANIRNIGWEFSVAWRDQFTLNDKSFTYNISFNISDYQGKVTKYSNPHGLLSDWYEGEKMGEIWGYTTDHIMTNAVEASEVNTSGFQNKFGSNWSQGDMKYKDIDKSGFIDNGANTLEDHGDLSVIGNNTPRYNYGFSISGRWNGFDLSIFLQGTAKRDLWLSGRLAWGIGGGQWGSNVWENTLDTWRNDGSNMDPYWPKFYLGNTSKNLQVQTKYLNSGAYCRIKNLQLGYTIPHSLTQRFSIENLHIYFSGENLFTISKINQNFDPEAPSDNVYPLSKSMSVGINLTL